MKKNFLLIVCAVALVFGLCSCGGGGVVKPVSEKVQGPLSEYFQVVSKDYKILDDGWGATISVEIKRIKEGFPEPWEAGMEVGYSDGKFEPLFTIELQDADGSVVSKDQCDIVFDSDDLKEIAALGVDESATITFDAYGDGIAQFKIGSTFKVHEAETTSRSSSSSSYSSSYSNDDDSDDDSDEDWDAFLDEYEEYVDDYVALYKKAMNGDMDALSEYAEVLEDAQDLNNRLSKAKGSMSSSQVARYTKITNKMVNAMK